ncbi:hypothetical protein SLEP1_g31210 [Rubroshorea leprosula]|uniref:non-specific serine/threonine protein kinase n=1 Tax=Rubroshorea leprosula TaxID=152421 RepID=A0AAV5KA66_9ROSI|nr:hypothetical protein SLEP1_g31210 [Rubroshorea leprosula]
MALIAFKSKVSNDPQGILKSWNDSIHFCRWKGITCSRRRDRVTILDLSSRDLVGSLSPFIGNLSFLREIRLLNNTFHGDIPSEIGRLFRLQVLNLNENSFEGKLPPNLSHCSNLNALKIDNKKLVGKLPMELASMSKFKNLSIRFSHFTGGIPPFIGNLTSLAVLSTGGNDFGGNIPDALGQLRSLWFLGLGGNNLFGKIPPSIYNLSMISIFFISNNQLEGNLPWEMGLTLPNLEQINLGRNTFSGQIPIILSNSSKLERLEMPSKNFSRKLKVPPGLLQHLQWLSFADNHLRSGDTNEMNFLTSLVNCSKLQYLVLAINQFQGRLPKSIANLSIQLIELHFQRNNLFGDITPGLGNLVGLSILALHDNQFTGKIPREIGQPEQLDTIALGINKLSGEIPDSFGNLKLLRILGLEQNKLNGSIPSSLGNCQSFKMLVLSQNDLSGSTPKELFSISAFSFALCLSHNHLVGSLPIEIGQLRNLDALDVSDNMLSREIPNSLSGCISLEFLFLDRNHFQGSIPESLSSLRGILFLDLSVNNLTGKIPQYMENLTLEYLNLSFNNFEGEMPTKGIFRNASAISVEGNKNLCGGMAELGLPKCRIKATKKGVLEEDGTHADSKSALPPSPKAVKADSLEERVTLLPSSNAKLGDAINVHCKLCGNKYSGEKKKRRLKLKVLDLLYRGASKSFMAECEALTNIRYRNIVKIITSCSSIDSQGNDFKALVYELMPNGSLDNWLHASAQETNNAQSRVQSLSLLQRISIAIDVASALDYLHYHFGKPIFHCDLKPSNVLLDNDMIAHVGDFGLAKFISSNSKCQTKVVQLESGTIGYAAPGDEKIIMLLKFCSFLQYGMGSEVSISGDIYSYWILVLEMMTGKKPTDNLFQGGFNLHHYARMTLPDQIVEIVDPKLVQEAEATIVNRQRSRFNT